MKLLAIWPGSTTRIRSLIAAAPHTAANVSPISFDRLATRRNAHTLVSVEPSYRNGEEGLAASAIARSRWMWNWSNAPFQSSLEYSTYTLMPGASESRSSVARLRT